MLMSSDARSSLILVVLIQFLAIARSFVTLIKGKLYRNIKEGRSLLIIVGLLSTLNLLILYALFATKNLGS